MNELYDDENAHTIISDKDELEDLFDFILMNEHISIENDSPFNRKVIIDIKRAINNDHKYGLTEEQVNTIKKGFIDSKDAFHLNTPKIITSDRECFKAALEISIDSIDYTFLAEEEEFEDRIIELAKKQKYILKEISPCYLKSNYEVSLNSLSLDVNSADWIEWYCFEDKPEELNNLLEIIIKNGKYELSYNSHDILCKNRDIIMCSIKRDVDTFHYAETSPEEDHEIFKYLVLHDYYNENDLKYYFSINNFIDKDIIGYLLENSCLGFNFWTMDDAVRETYHSSKSTNLYFERVTELYYKALSTAPKISNFETALRYFSETVWEKKRNDNINYYGNIFNKICSALRANSFDDACNSLAFLKNMKDMLGAKQYDELIKTMRTYYNLYSEKKTSSDDFQNARDKISELSAKYIAISKENTKNEWIKNCYYDIKIREYYK